MNEADSTNSEGRVKLVYLYIHKFRNIHKQGIRLTSDFIFETEAKDSHVSITISHNQNHIDDFFRLSNERDESNPSDSEFEIDVTAIVGENGTGKSNILDLIGTFLSGAALTEQCLAIFLTDTRLQMHCNFDPKRVEIKNHTLIDILVSANSKNGLNYNDTDIASINHNHLLPFRIVKYSHSLEYNLLDIKYSKKVIADRKGLLHSNLIDITTRMMLEQDIENYDSRSFSKLDAFHYMEIERGLQLLTNFPSSISDIKNIPANVFIHLSQDQRFTSDKRFLELSGFVALDAELLRAEEDSTLSIKEKYFLFRRRIQRSFVSNLIYKYSNEIDLVHLNGVVIAIGPETIIRNGFVPLLSELSEHFQPKKSRLSFEIDYNFVFRYITFFNKIHRAARYQSKDGFEEIQIRVRDITSQLLAEMLSGLKGKTRVFNKIVSYNWRRMSSGEQARFSFFGRLNAISEQLQDTPNLLILIDEGDLNYHPEWQRKFLIDTMEFLRHLFKNKSVQLIFTSNTPFLVSELPKDKVVHLTKEPFNVNLRGELMGQQNRMSVDDGQRPETFASNIHTLLASNFYLTSFLGEFAKKKIENVVRALSSKNDDLPPERIENIKKLINQVGEPIIKKRLEHLYFEKTGEGPETVEDRIKKLRDEVDRLEKGQKKNENS